MLTRHVPCQIRNYTNLLNFLNRDNAAPVVLQSIPINRQGNGHLTIELLAQVLDKCHLISCVGPTAIQRESCREQQQQQ